MYLKSLELSGFKSFAKKTVLSFKTPITAIVGPNGSGKSNIAEGFRFVLGEQSLKSMRGKRTEDLIWGGSPGASRGSRASVAVTFDNSQKLLDIDFDEVTIERVIHRDASSEYRLNSSPVRLKDINELLAQAHIGATGHHIISQGEADRILSVAPKERKQMVEDALGLKVYQYKKAESIRKLEKTAENIKEVEGLRREIKPHLRFLQKQVEKIERAHALREELKERFEEYAAREAAYLDYQKNALHEERTPLEEKRTALEKELETIQQTLSSLETKDTKTQEIVSVQEELRRVREEKDAHTRKLGQLEGEAHALERAIAREQKQTTQEQTITVSLQTVREFTDTILTHTTNAHDAADIGAVRSVLGKLREAVKGFLARIGSAPQEAHTTTYENELHAVTEKQKHTAAEAHMLEKKEHELEAQYEKLKQAVEKEHTTARESERKMFALTQEHNDIRMQLGVLEGKERERVLQHEEFERDKAEVEALVGSLSLTGIEVGESSKTFADANVKTKKEIEKMKIRLEEAGGGSGEEIMKEHTQVQERDSFLERELADLERSAQSLRELIADLDTKLEEEFQAGIEKINKEFQNFFSLMFGGGTALLRLVQEKKRARAFEDELALEDLQDEDEEIQTGVEISVSLPRKRIKGLTMLSGGERALTSIALLFALSQVNPPPFIILDETDAALDEANSRKYGDMIEELSKHSQLILITHNRETMSRAGVLYGVTMGANGVSQLLSVGFDEAVQVAK